MDSDEYQCLHAIEQAYKTGDQGRIRPLLMRQLEMARDTRSLVLRMLNILRNVNDLEMVRPRLANILLETYRQFFHQNAGVKARLVSEMRELWPSVIDVVRHMKSQSSLQTALKLFCVDFEHPTLADALNTNEAPLKMFRFCELLAHQQSYQQIVHLLIQTNFPTRQYPIAADLFLFQLFAHNHLQDLYAFCEYDPSVVADVVRFLDDHLFDRASQWPTVNLVKIINRLLKIAQSKNESVPVSAYPKAQRNHLVCVLSYLMKLRFREQSIGPVQFADLIRDLMRNQNMSFKIQFLEKLIRFRVDDEIREWIDYFEIPFQYLPSKFSVYQLSGSGWTKTVAATRNRSSFETYKKLSLAPNRVHFIDSVSAFKDAIEQLERSQMIGIDAEWKPFCAEIGRESNVALLQLATETDAYLIDVLALKSYTGIWNKLVRVFQSTVVQKIGYNMSGDFLNLYRSVPNIQSLAISSADFIDLGTLFRHLQLLPQLQRYLDDSYIGMEASTVPSAAITDSPLSDHANNRSQSLSRIVRVLFGCDLDKSWQISNWELRPLRPEQIRYAALDAHCLIEIFEHLQNMCAHNGIVLEDVLFKIARRNYQKKLRSVTIRRPAVAVTVTPSSSHVQNTFRVSDDLLVFQSNVTDNDLLSTVRKTGFKTHLLSDSVPFTFMAFVRSYRQRNPSSAVYLVTTVQHVVKIASFVPAKYRLALNSVTPLQQLQEIIEWLGIELEPSYFYGKCLKCGSNSLPQTENVESDSENNDEVSTSTHYRYYRDDDDDANADNDDYDDDDDDDAYNDNFNGYDDYDANDSHDFEELKAPIVFTRSQNQPKKTVLVLCCDSCNYRLRIEGGDLTSLQQTWLAIIRDA